MLRYNSYFLNYYSGDGTISVYDLRKNKVTYMFTFLLITYLEKNELERQKI